MRIPFSFRGMRWQVDDEAHGVNYGARAHNLYNRNTTFQPLLQGEKSDTLPDADFQFARNFYLHDDKLVATINRIDITTTQVKGDLARRMYFVENGLLQFITYNELPEFGVDPNPYPTPTVAQGHRSGVPAPLEVARTIANPTGGPVIIDEVRTNANAAGVGAGTQTNYDDLPEEEKVDYLETNFVYTYVNKYGEEGPPSAPSRTVFLKPDQTRYYLTDIFESTDPDVFGIRIYVLFQGDYYQIPNPSFTIPATAETAEIPNITLVNDPTSGGAPIQLPPTETFLPQASANAVGGLLVSRDWFQAPDGLKHLAALDNGILAVANDHQILLSVKYNWHAFPAVSADYYSVDKIVRIARINNGMAVLTEKGTHFWYGTEPEAFYESDRVLPYPITDANSLTVIDDGLAYVCADGIVAMNNSGGSLITDGWIDRNEWQERVTLSESRTELYEGRILLATRDPSTGNPIGYMFNMAEREITSFDIVESQLLSGFFRDLRDNEVHSVVDAIGLARFNKGTNMIAVWESGDIILPKFQSFNTFYAKASQYPLTFTMIYPDGTEFNRQIDGIYPTRIMPNCRSGCFRVRLTAPHKVQVAAIAESMREV